MSAYVLDAAVATAIDRDDVAEGARQVDALASLAARAHLHRSRLGDRSALATARLLAASIDNPDLRACSTANPSPDRRRVLRHVSAVSR
jgi:hypothetical protein